MGGIFPMQDFSYGVALVLMQQNKKVERRGWNGKGMYVFLTPHAEAHLPTKLGALPKTIELEPHIVMRTADGKFVPWLCSQTDGLANDWCVTEDA